MDMSPYRDLFVSESREHLTAFNDLILQLEEGGDDPAAIAELFRHAHSLKGMAATMGLGPISTMAHAMESQLSRVRNGETGLTRPLADLLLEAGDALAGMVTLVEGDAPLTEEHAALRERLLAFGSETPADETPTGVPAEPEPAPAPPAADRHQFRQSDSLKSVRVRTETLDRLVNVTGELITTRHRLQECAERLGDGTLQESLRQLTLLLRNLRDEVLSARMLPFSLIAERFPRMVRDLARSLDKEVAFAVEGREIELDRSILEEITEPLIHILRNALDHGMEPPAERRSAGKPEQGEIRLTVRRDKDSVEIAVSDDGRGMNPQRLIGRAVEKGLLTPERGVSLTDEEAFMLVCEPGFSTAAAVSDISGRGVGMDAVKNAIHSLGGTLRIESACGTGSRFVLRLPVSVSIIHALVTRCGRYDLALPVTSVRRTLELGRDDILEEAGRKVVRIDEETLPIFSLNRLLRQPPPAGGSTGIVPAVICDIGNRQAAFVTDRLVGQQEIFVKPLEAPLSALRGLNGATVAGDGRIMFVLDIPGLA